MLESACRLTSTGKPGAEASVRPRSGRGRKVRWACSGMRGDGAEPDTPNERDRYLAATLGRGAGGRSRFTELPHSAKPSRATTPLRLIGGVRGVCEPDRRGSTMDQALAAAGDMSGLTRSRTPCAHPEARASCLAYAWRTTVHAGCSSYSVSTPRTPSHNPPRGVLADRGIPAQQGASCPDGPRSGTAERGNFRPAADGPHLHVQAPAPVGGGLPRSFALLSKGIQTGSSTCRPTSAFRAHFPVRPGGAMPATSPPRNP